MEFQEFPKIPRLSREMVITEKLDGTNACVRIEVYDDPARDDEYCKLGATFVHDLVVFAGSRTRFVTPGKNDNYGFAGWVKANALDLVKLGVGTHFGEWWGKGIQRGYGLTEKRFSLFNTHRWGDPAVRPSCCHVVPVLYTGPFNTLVVDVEVRGLAVGGSIAAPGFMNPEGVVVYHTAGNLLFKKTIEKDNEHKGAAQG